MSRIYREWLGIFGYPLVFGNLIGIISKKGTVVLSMASIIFDFMTDEEGLNNFISLREIMLKRKFCFRNARAFFSKYSSMLLE